MLNSIQHLRKSRTYGILKQVQDDKTGLFTGLSTLAYSILNGRSGKTMENRLADETEWLLEIRTETSPWGKHEK